MKVSKQTTWVNRVSWSGNASDIIQEVAGLNTGWGTDYPGWGSLWILSVPLEKCQDCNLNYAMATSFHILTNSSFALVQLFVTTVSELLRVKLKELWTNTQINKKLMSELSILNWWRITVGCAVIILNLINLLLYCSHQYRVIYSVQFAKNRRKSIAL